MFLSPKRLGSGNNVLWFITFSWIVTMAFVKVALDLLPKPISLVLLAAISVVSATVSGALVLVILVAAKLLGA